MKIKTYQPRPIEVQAFQLTYDMAVQDIVFQKGDRIVYGLLTQSNSEFKGDFVVETIEGNMTAYVGDYIVIGTHGELYPVRKDIFEEKYEASTE